MCVVTGPITMEPELLGERVFLVSGILTAAFDKAPLCTGWGGPGRLEPAHIWRPAQARGSRRG